MCRDAVLCIDDAIASILQGSASDLGRVPVARVLRLGKVCFSWFPFVGRIDDPLPSCVRSYVRRPPRTLHVCRNANPAMAMQATARSVCLIQRLVFMPGCLHRLAWVRCPGSVQGPFLLPSPLGSLPIRDSNDPTRTGFHPRHVGMGTGHEDRT